MGCVINKQGWAGRLPPPRPPLPTNLTKLKKAELQELAGKFGLDTKGLTKDEIIQKLEKGA